MRFLQYAPAINFRVLFGPGLPMTAELRAFETSFFAVVALSSVLSGITVYSYYRISSSRIVVVSD